MSSRPNAAPAATVVRARNRAARFVAGFIATAVLAVSVAGCSGDSLPPSPAAGSTTTAAPATSTPTSAPPSTTTSASPPPATSVPPSTTTSAPPSTTTSVPDEPTATAPAAAAPANGIGWEDLEHLSVEISGDVIRLEEGRATVSYGGESASIYTLQNRVAEGDLDGDGDSDVVAHLVERSAGTGVFHFVVPVIDDEGDAVAMGAVTVGDRIVMDDFSVHDGLIEVSLFDRAFDEPFSIISRYTTLAIDVSAPTPVVTVVSTEPIEDLPLPDPERPAIDIRFDPGAVSATESGSIMFRERQPYTVQASQDQVFTATLGAPLGVWLDVRLGEQVVTSASQRSQLVEATLPESGAWEATVVSSHAGRVDYQLIVEVLPPGDDTPAPPTTTVPTVRPPWPVTPDDEGNVVYLTFDDGPNPLYTPQVLDVLARYDARATFFVLGALVEAYPAIIERIVAEGHTVANHTWNHEVLAGLPRPAFDETVSRTQGILADLATPCLRPPYASIDAFTQEWAAEHGLAVMMWTIDPGDWRRPPATEIADHIVERARSGAVVLLHDGGGNRENTVQGLELALERLADQDLRYEPVCR